MAIYGRTLVPTSQTRVSWDNLLSNLISVDMMYGTEVVTSLTRVCSLTNAGKVCQILSWWTKNEPHFINI